jgi:transcriptional regulator with XRE-family HTH domain
MDAPNAAPDDRPPHPRWLPAHHAAYTDAFRRWHRVIVTLGAAVKEVRELLGWSQMKLGTRAVVSQGAVSRVESGTNDSLPFTTVAKLLTTLGHAADQAGLQLSPSTQALLQFVDPTIGSILAAEIDPQFAALVQGYHRLSPSQQAAFGWFMVALVTPGPEPDPDYGEIVPPPTGGT